MFRYINLTAGLLGRVGLLRIHKMIRRPIGAHVTFILVVLSLLTQRSAQAIAPSVVPATQGSDPALKAIDYLLNDAAADSNIVYVCSASNIGRTNDISALSPSWANITPPNVGTLYDCVPDPSKPQEKMWAVSSNGIWKGENLNMATPLWTLLQTTDQIRSATDGFTQNGSEPDRIIASIRIPGTVFVLYSHGGLASAPKTWVGRSTDDGLTWSWSKVADEGAQARDFGFAISQNANSPDAVTVWATSIGGHLYTSTDGGVTFLQNLQLPPSNFYQLHSIYAPIADPDGSILYVGDGSDSRGTAYMYRTLDGGDTWTNISPIGSDTQPRGPFRQYEIRGPLASPARLYALVQRPQDVVGENKKLYYSDDSGTSWTLRFDFATWPFEVLGMGVNAFDENRVYVLRQDMNYGVSSELIFTTYDGGITWNDKSGNWKSNVGSWTGAVAVWDASVAPIEPPVTDHLATLELRASPIFVENQPIILQLAVHNLTGPLGTYTYSVSLLQDGNIVEAKPEAQLPFILPPISFGERPKGSYQIRAELKHGTDVIDSKSLSVMIVSAGQQMAFLKADELEDLALTELDQMGDIVTNRYIDALTFAAEEGTDQVIDVLSNPFIKSLSDLGNAAGLNQKDVTYAAREIVKECSDITNWLKYPIEDLSGSIRQHVDNRLTPQEQAIKARKEAFNTFIASRGPFTWTLEMENSTIATKKYISNRVEEEQTPVGDGYRGTAGTLMEADNQFDWMRSVGEKADRVTVALCILVLVVAVLSFTPAVIILVKVVGAVMTIPELIYALSVIKSLFGAILPLIMAMTMLFSAGNIVAPAVTRGYNDGLDNLTNLISQSGRASIETLGTESSVNDGQVALTTQLGSVNFSATHPMGETYVYGADGSIVKILSQQLPISAGGTETTQEILSLPPGRYKAVTSIYGNNHGSLASQVSAFEIPDPALSLDVSLSRSQLSLGQAVQASISVANRDSGPGTGDLAVVAQSSDGQHTKAWLVNLGPGASQQVEFGFAPQTTGSFRLRVSVSDGNHLLSLHDSAYIVGDGAAFAVNVASETVYPPSLAVTIPLTVTNAGNLPGSTTLSLVTYDQASPPKVVHTVTLPLSVGAGTNLDTSLIALPVELSQPGSYTALLYLDNQPYTNMDFQVAARDTLFASIIPDNPFHHVGDAIPLTVTVLNSAFAHEDASIQVSLWQPDGITQTVTMSPISTGQYRGQVTAPIRGTYIATVQVFKRDYRLVGSQSVFVVEESSQLQASVEGLAILGSTRPITLTVSNENGIPIVGARLTISGTHEYLSRSTDEMGRIVVYLSPNTTNAYQVELEKPGFATTLMDLPVRRAPDVTHPDLVFFTPSITRQTPSTVTGLTEAGSHLTVNDEAVAIDSQGFFTTTVALTEGPNLLVGIATDAAGNSITVTHTITLDTVPPSLVVTTPPDGLITTENVVQIAGSAEIGAQVLVNDIFASVDTTTGAFSAWVLLKPRANTISITAADNAGNTAIVDRVVTNGDTQSKLIIIKHVVNDNGGTATAADFTMSVSGTNVSPTSFPGDENGTTVVLDAGSYSVGETGSSGYAVSFSADCTGTIALGETKTCTVTNDDIPPKLVVIKHVINDNGGAAVAGDFTINVTGYDISPALFPGDENGTTVTLNAGNYEVSETGRNGYTSFFSIECSGAIASGETKTCTITNDDIQFVDIDIVPHSIHNYVHFHRKYGPIGLIQVAILSTSDFDAPSVVDRTSLTFGHTGDEESLRSCFDAARDVNHDGLKDLVCVFQGGLTGFKVGDTAGILKGKTVDGMPIEGSDAVNIVTIGKY